jgi:hypothetical protein
MSYLSEERKMVERVLTMDLMLLLNDIREDGSIRVDDSSASVVCRRFESEDPKGWR